jgi:hypothetical protein
MNCRSLRSAVSLVELLIVIAIIAMLLQLILPAVEGSREAARKTTCQDHLRQIGIAAALHESSLQNFPTAGWGWGWIGDPDQGSGEKQPGSWAYQLLPYLEQQNTYGISRGLKGDAKAEALTSLAATPISLMYCPSRRLPRATPNVGPAVDVEGHSGGELFWFNAKKAETLARMDFAGNVGDRFVYWNAGPTPADAMAGKGFFVFRDIDGVEVTIEEVTGVIAQRRPVQLQHVTDGLSNTYFCGEKSIPIEAYKAGWNTNDDQSCWNGDDLDTVATTQFVPRRDFSVEDKLEGRVGVPFGSAHPSGMFMLLCDGSVQLVDYNIDAKVHQRMGNRRDERAIQQ